MIEIRKPEPDPIETALLEWIPSADLYLDGERTHEGLNLLGGNEVTGKAWARIITKHLATNGYGLMALTAALLDPKGAAQHVRTYAFAPQVAEGILAMLDRKGLLP
ncbi:hypothetical protein [Nocardia pseudovaccinii]|uniref:hypothetical protein n=1 Tax=Nocardia pseudovaccinii TaxID=189540 RepID=UPI0007A4387B|nr:hypothetical protein [Nocardia pseudovaccinii]